MADKETGLGIPVSAYADENSAKKAIQDLTKSILGALKDGYIEIPTAISDEFDKSKASAKLIRAQKDFLNQWGKMSKEGFSSSEEDLQAFVDKFTEFKRLMGKEGKGGSKQNLAIRDLGLGELVQSYKKQFKAIQTMQTEAMKSVNVPQTKVKSTRKSSKKYIDTGAEISDKEIKANIKQEKDRRYRGIETVLPRGIKSNSGVDPGRSTEDDLLKSEISSHRSNMERQSAQSLKQALKEQKPPEVTRPGAEAIEQAINNAFKNGNNKNNISKEQAALEKRNITSNELAKILGGLEHARPDTSIQQFNDYLNGIFTFNNQAGKSEWDAIFLSLSKTFHRYFNTEGNIGSTNGKEKGVYKGHENAKIAITGMFEKFKEILEQNGLTAELARTNKILARIDPRIVEAANSLNTITTSTTRRQTVSSDSILGKEIQSLNQEQKRQTTTLESQRRLDIMENSAERISDNKTDTINREVLDVTKTDASTGFNTDEKALEMFAHQITTNRLLGEVKNLLSQIFNVSGGKSGRGRGGNGRGNPPTIFNSANNEDDSNSIGSYQSILLQITQHLKNIDINVGNILQSVINITGKVPTNLPAIIDGEGVKTHPVEKEPITDKTNYNLLHDKKISKEVETERTAAIVHNAVQKYVEEDRKKNAQERLNEEAKQKYTGGLEMSKVISSTPGFFGRLQDTISKAFSSQSEAERIMNMNRNQQARMRAQRLEIFGENRGRNLTDTGDKASVKRTKELFGWIYKNDGKNKELFQDIRLTPGFNKDTTIDTTKILKSLNKVLSGPEMFKAQTGGTLRNLIGSFTGYLGMPSIEKSRAEADGLNQVMSNVRNEMTKLVQSIQAKEMALKGMQEMGTARFDSQGRITEDSSSAARKTFIDLEEQKSVLRSALAEVSMIDDVVGQTGGKIHDIVKNLGFVMPELMENNTILQNINAGLDKNGKALKFQTRTGEVLNYSFQLLSRHIGQIVKNWMWMINPINLIKKAFSDFASYDVKWQRTMNVIKYNIRRIIKPFMEWLAQQFVNIIGLVNALIKGIGSAFGQNWDLFDKTAASAEKTREEMEAAANVSAGFDELHDIGSGSDPATDLSGDIYTPQWDGLNKVLEDIGNTIGNIVKAVSDWTFWDWLILAGAALTGFVVLKTLISWFTGKNPLESVAKGFKTLQTTVGWAILIASFALFTNTLKDFITTIGTMDPWAVVGALTTLAAGFGILVGAMIILSKTVTSDWKTLLGMAALVGVFTGITAVLIPFIKVLKEVTAKQLMSGLIFLAGALLSVSVAIGALAIVFTAITSTGVGLAALGILAGIMALLPLVILSLSEFVRALGESGEGIKLILEGIALVINSIGEQITNIFTTIGTIIIAIVQTISDGIQNILQPILDFIDTVIGKIMELASTIVHEIGETIGKVIETTGRIILEIINSLMNVIPMLSQSILNFIGQIGPAIESSVDSILRTITKLINFTISGIEYLINTLLIDSINAAISTVTLGLFPHVFDRIEIARFVPQYEKGTNYVPNDGLAYLHQGEAVVPKKYNQPLETGLSVEEQLYMRQMISTMKSLDNTMKQGIPVSGQFVQRGSDLVAVVNKTKAQTGADLLSNVSYAR